MLAHGLGIAPFKDNFWTTSDQHGNPKYVGKPLGSTACFVVVLSIVSSAEWVWYMVKYKDPLK